MADFGLLVGSIEYGGWKSLEVTRSIDTMCASFSFGFSEKIDGAWPIEDGDGCTVMFGGKPLITGYAFTAGLSLKSESTIGGRCKVSDVIDSSPRLDKWTFKNSTPDAIARALCKPFGVNVSVQPGLALSALPCFSVDPGDNGGAVLGKLCKAAGILAMPDEIGGLVFTRSGRNRCTTALVEGENLIDGSSSRDSSQRFGEYRVLAQGKGSNTANGSTVAAVKGSAKDAGARAQRLMVVRPDGSHSLEQAKARAEWEAMTRVARGLTLDGLMVNGWTQADGSLWRENSIVHVKSQRLRVEGDFLIKSVKYSRTKTTGTTTTMDCVSKAAFTPEPIKNGAGFVGWKELRGGV